MTSFYDPLRPRSPGNPPTRPRWMNAPVVLPHLMLDPMPDGSWLVMMMMPVPGRPDAHTWYPQRFSVPELDLFLSNWRADPERAVETHFGRGAPDGSGQVESETIQAGASLEDLDL